MGEKWTVREGDVTDLSRPWVLIAAFASRAIFSTLRSLRHLADRAVQASLFELLPRLCCIVPAAARREGVYHSVDDFFD